jgi:hypothetical protein
MIFNKWTGSINTNEIKKVSKSKSKEKGKEKSIKIEGAQYKTVLSAYCSSFLRLKTYCSVKQQHRRHERGSREKTKTRREVMRSIQVQIFNKVFLFTFSH